MKYLWDTHAWIWAANNDAQLSRKARALLAATVPAEHAIADISLWETAMLMARGRVAVPGAPQVWFAQALATVTVLPISSGVALHSADAGWAHHDPADRLIVATALEHGLTLVSKDAAIAKWGGVRVLW